MCYYSVKFMEGFMKKQTKRLIASMVMAVSLSISAISLTLAFRYNEEYTSLNKEFETRQMELYNKLKKDPDYQYAYKNHLNDLQEDFLSGEIDAQKYANELNDLTKTDTFVFKFSQRPEVQQEYSAEITKMKQLENDMHKHSVEKGYPSIAGLVGGTIGFTSGAAIMTSTIDEKDEDKYCL